MSTKRIRNPENYLYVGEPRMGLKIGVGGSGEMRERVAHAKTRCPDNRW